MNKQIFPQYQPPQAVVPPVAIRHELRTVWRRLVIAVQLWQLRVERDRLDAGLAHERAFLEKMEHDYGVWRERNLQCAKVLVAERSRLNYLEETTA